MPIAEFESRMKRKSASRQSANASVRTPKATRMPLKTVRRLARTMLAVERLVAGGSTGPRASRRRRASSSVRPAAAAEEEEIVSVRIPRLHRAGSPRTPGEKSGYTHPRRPLCHRCSSSS
jgi:hypothetical protein